MYIVSACLAGINCRFDGGNSLNQNVKTLVDNGNAIPVCPEVLGGLSVPRLRCELKTLPDGTRNVLDVSGNDVTKNFLKGAHCTLTIAQDISADTAILKSKSPSCGAGKIYDGSFSKRLVEGNGITAQLLIDNGIKILTEDELE